MERLTRLASQFLELRAESGVPDDVVDTGLPCEHDPALMTVTVRLPGEAQASRASTSTS